MSALSITIFTLALILLDQLSKFAAVAYLKPVGTMSFIPYVLSLVYVENTGAAFSMLDGYRYLLLGVTGAVLIVAMVALYKNLFGDKFANICLLFIIAGGWGNFIDRLFRGYVVDYFNFLPFKFAVFNVADCYVVCGVIALVVYMLFFNKDLLKDKKI